MLAYYFEAGIEVPTELPRRRNPSALNVAESSSSSCDRRSRNWSGHFSRDRRRCRAMARGAPAQIGAGKASKHGNKDPE